MIRTLHVESYFCDICDLHTSFPSKCGICGRDVCLRDRVPYTLENRPAWHPVFDYLCSDCAIQPEIEQIKSCASIIREAISVIHKRVACEDDMGRAAKEGDN